MLGEREARGKSIYSMKKTLDLHEMDSLPPRLSRGQALAAYRRSAGKDKYFQLNALLVIPASTAFGVGWGEDNRCCDI